MKILIGDKNLQISTLMDGMEKYWPSLSCGSPSSCHGGKGSFWGHEVIYFFYNFLSIGVCIPWPKLTEFHLLGFMYLFAIHDGSGVILFPSDNFLYSLIMLRVYFLWFDYAIIR